MKEKFLKTRKKIAEKLDIPKEVILNVPKITMVGDFEVTIENHKGIISFSKEYIEVKSKIGVISVEGLEFEIRYIGETTIIINGLINSIYFGGIKYGDL